MRPPRGWRALLGILLPTRYRAFVLDDLEEDFRARAAADPQAARRRYRREVLRGLAPALRIRLTRGVTSSGADGLGRRRLGRPGPGRVVSGRISGGPESLLRDLRIAARNLRARPGYLALTTATLTIGVGASVVMFGVVDAFVFAELPYRDADRLVVLYERSLDDPELDRFPVTPANFLDWQRMAEGFEHLAAYDYRSAVFVEDEAAQRIRGVGVTGGMFGVLGARPLRGRPITPEDVAQEAPVVVLSHGFWTRAFGQAADVVGSEILLDREPTTVVGIMVPDFRFPFMDTVDVWRPLVMDAETANDRTTARLFVVGRLRDGVTALEARAEVDAIATALGERHPETGAHRGITLLEQRDEWLELWMPMLTTFGLAVGVALAVACLNLTGLMLSRGLARADEIAMRLALGAGTLRITRLLLTEAVLIAVLGAGLGAVAAMVLMPLIVGSLPPGFGGAMLEDVEINARALLFAGFVALATAVVAGAGPAFRLPRSRLSGVLGDARSAGGRTQLYVRRTLVVAQTMLALVILGQAAVMARSMYNAYNQDLGFDHRGVLSARMRIDPDHDDPLTFFERIRDEAAALPGVTAATLANIPPLSGEGMPVAITVDGSTPSSIIDAEGFNREVQMRLVGPEFFELLGIPTLAGRTFGDGDRIGSERVAVVNESFARMFFPGTQPLGAPLRAALYFRENPDGFDAPRRVVGMVGDVAEWGIWMQPPIVYVPHPQEQPRGYTSILLRTVGPPERLAEPLEELVWRLGSRAPVERVSTLAGFMSTDLYVMLDFVLSMIGAFAIAAVTLAAIGLYGVIAFQVQERRREISIRIAVGARAADILAAVLREGVLLASLGVVLGGAATTLIGPRVADSFVGRFIFEVGWFDIVSIGTAATVLLLTAVLACVQPARRAAAVDPLAALKES